MAAAEAEAPVIDQAAADVAIAASATNNNSAMEVEQKKEEDDCNFKLVNIDETAKVSWFILNYLIY